MTGAERTPEWKVGHVSDALRGQRSDERIIPALRYVIEVLNTNNLSDGLRLDHLIG